MSAHYRQVLRISFRIFIIISIAVLYTGVTVSRADPPVGTFYYPPGNVPPGPPPNYNQVDTSYFLGTPTLPLPPPDSGGVYIWVDSAGWNVASHIYSQGNSYEQFHGSVLAMLGSPPEPGVNVFTNGFELFGDTSGSLCYGQNDRWGWYQWAENLYEIWWDVCTREWQQGSGDPNDFMIIKINGCAIDFNVWSSGHGNPFDTDQIFLGGNMIRLSDVPGFVDTYPGIGDPYQSQAGSNPETDPNITVFTKITGTGYSYNKDGLITYDQTYPCGQILGEDYGNRFSGPFVYEGNGVQFSSSCLSDPCLYNNPPVASVPGDTAMLACGPDDICLDGFSYSDPDGNLLSVEVTGGVLNGNTVCFTPAKGQNTITLICTDECGAADTAVTVVTVAFNNFPTASGPGDTTMFVCDLSQVCLSGFSYDDIDANIASVDVTGGTLNGDEVCFMPVAGANTITLIVTDECGAADTAVTMVTVDLNSAPTASSPDDTTMFVCDLGQVCLSGFAYNDVDGNIASVDVTGGTLNGGEVCLTPVVGANTITLIVTDECGAADTAVTVVTVGLNSAPTASSPADTAMFVCDPGQVCLSGFTYNDVNGNIASVDVTGGTLNGDEVCFTPVAGANTITLIVTDECGAADTAVTVVTVDLNSAPTASSPADTAMFVCDLSQVCLSGFTYNDVDGNIASVDVTGGTLNGGEVCFMPVVGANTITLIVADECGAADTAVTVVTVTLNSSPVASSPDDTTLFVCDLSQACLLGFGYNDVDGNIASVDVTGGTLNGGEVCFTPVVGANTITLIVADECGEADTAVTVVTVGLNNAPFVNCPGDTSMLICDLSDICLSGFGYGDANYNIESIELNVGTYDNGSVCFTPTVGENTIALTVTDSCGLSVSCTTTVFTTMNNTPQITCMDDTVMVVDDLSDICLSGVDYSDPDGNIASVVVEGGTMVGDEVCFTPEVGINNIRIIVADDCGAADSCDVNVTIGYCAYLPGDANADFSVNGLDISIMVTFFKGGPPLPDTCDCRPDLDQYPFFGAGDDNGDCFFNGLDITYLKNYLTSVVDQLYYCPSCPPTAGWEDSFNGGNAPRTAAFREGKGENAPAIDK